MFRRTGRACVFVPAALVAALSSGCGGNDAPGVGPAPSSAASASGATTPSAKSAATFRPGEAALPFPAGGAPKVNGATATASTAAAAGTSGSAGAGPVGPGPAPSLPVLVWALAKELPTDGPVAALAASPKGDFVVACGVRGVQRWDVPGWTPSKPLVDAPKNGTVVAVSPAGDWIAAASGTVAGVGKIHLWQAPFDSKPTILSGHYGPISALAWSPAAPLRLASGGVDREVRLWDAADLKAKPKVYTGHRDYVSQIVFAPDGASFITAGGDKTLLVWNPNEAKPIRTFTQHLAGISSLAASSDGTRIAAGETTGAIYVWDATKGEVLGVLPGHGQVVTAVAFRPAAAAEFASAGGDGRLRIWNTESRQLVGEGGGAKDYLNSLAFAADGGWICAAGEESRLFVWTAPAK